MIYVLPKNLNESASNYIDFMKKHFDFDVRTDSDFTLEESKSKCSLQRNLKKNLIYRFGGNVLVCTLELAPPLSSSSNEFAGLS